MCVKTKVAVWYAKYVFGNKMLYSVQPRHLHYTDVMSLLCHVWFGLVLALVLTFEYTSLGLGLELLSLESKPGWKNITYMYTLA